MPACTCTATSARAWLVSATSPSIPAVLRPVLRCVTCRTLTSVLLQLRSISFCKFLAEGQSPSCTALKILPRSRRTCSSWWRQSTCSQASPSNEGRPSGPFTEVSNMPISTGIYARFVSKAHLPTSAPLRARAPRSVSGQLYEHPSGRRPGPAAPAFLLPFSHRHSLFGHPVLPGNSAPLTVGLPHRLRLPAPGIRTHSRVSTFRTHETQTGPGALFTPGTAVSAGHRQVRGRRPPPLSGRSLPSRHSHPARDVGVTRHQQGFPDSRPIPVLPRTCNRHDWSGGPWAFHRVTPGALLHQGSPQTRACTFRCTRVKQAARAIRVTPESP